MTISVDQARREAFRALDAEGAPEGIDEDCAVAVSWLEASRLEGLHVLADALDLSDRQERSLGLDADASGVFDAMGRSSIFFAPLVIDRLLDLAEQGGGSAKLELSHTRHPALFIACAARAVRDVQTVTVAWQAGDGVFKAQVSRQGVRLLAQTDAEPDWRQAEVLDLVTLTCDPGQLPEILPPWRQLASAATLRERLEHAYQCGIDVDAATLARVSRYATGILVPETEQSRAQGAGAGLTDND